MEKGHQRRMKAGSHQATAGKFESRNVPAQYAPLPCLAPVCSVLRARQAMTARERIRSARKRELGGSAGAGDGA